MRKLILSLSTLLLLLSSCTENLDTSARYVFKDPTIVTYLESQEVYSQYVDLMKKVPMSSRSTSSVYQLLTARGNYTVFAVTNDAIDKYLEKLVEDGLIEYPSWDAFKDSTKLDSIRSVIVKNSIVDGGDLESQRYTLALFPTDPNSELPLPNINDHKLTIFWPDGKPDSLYVNKECAIDSKNRDIPVTNGVIHQIHKVIAPNDQTCARYLQNILDNKQEGYLLMARVIQACGLLPTLSEERDEVYETMYQRGDIPDMKNYQDKGGGDKSATSDDPDAHAPEHRKIGFTIFAETDEYWRSQGIIPTDPDALQQLTQWLLKHNMYLSEDANLTDDNYTSKDHLLYRWITYHILPMRIPSNKLVYHCNEVGFNLSTPTKLSIPVYEWYCTLGGHRLLKIYESKESNGIFLNRFPVHDSGLSGTGHEVSCDDDKIGNYIDRENELTIVNDITNACIYPIDKPLAYTDDIRSNLSKERIRFDLFAMFPEAITNGIRRADSNQGKFQHVYIPQDNIYRYFDNMRILNENTHFIHYNGYRINWANYCQDEDKAFGRFDIMFALPPVPARGTYELRYKVLATGARGIVQVYFGSDPNNLPAAGIPIDMTKGIVDCFGENSTWSDISDEGHDEDQIIEIDHKLRNHGLMKAGRHEVHESNPSQTARDDSRQTRHILVRGFMDPEKTYYVRFKSVLDSEKKELYLDYMEWCPKEVYDNPNTPEDVW